MREANVVLFIAVLQKLAPYFFAIDLTRYARWLSVFIHDLETAGDKPKSIQGI